jgi:hypothetical protein
LERKRESLWKREGKKWRMREGGSLSDEAERKMRRE